MSGILRFPNVNNVIISGRLVRDIETRYSANGQAIVPICIAVNHYYQDEFGNKKEEASFVDAVAFGANAQKCQECLKKGSPVLIEGSIRTRTYVDKTGANRKSTEVNISRIYPLERDENFVPNQNYQGQNNYSGYQNNGYQNNQQNNQQNFAPRPQPTYPPPPPDVPAGEPVSAPVPAPEPAFPSYDQPETPIVTQDDVPF